MFRNCYPVLHFMIDPTLATPHLQAMRARALESRRSRRSKFVWSLATVMNSISVLEVFLCELETGGAGKWLIAISRQRRLRRFRRQRRQ